LFNIRVSRGYIADYRKSVHWEFVTFFLDDEVKPQRCAVYACSVVPLASESLVEVLLHMLVPTMPHSIVLTTKINHDNNEISSATSSLRGMMMVCSTKQALGEKREHRDVQPSPGQSLVLDDCQESCCYRNSDNTNYSSADDSSYNDHTETSIHNEIYDKSSGVSMSHLRHELQINEQTYGYTSLEVASTYNAIGLFHCRLYKDYNGALHYHTKALNIINTLFHLLQSASTQDISEATLDWSEHFKAVTSTAARKHESHNRIIPLLVTTYMDIGTCYELQQNYPMAIRYYEKTDDTIIRLEQQSNNSSSNSKTIIPKHITFACRRAIARVKRL
jgi:hypothetical protein